MTTPPAPATPDRPADDQALADLATSSGQYLAGAIAAGMLDALGQPARLPELLFPHMPPEHVREVWQAALIVGYRAGRLTGRPSFTRAELSRLQGLLADAGHEAMARLTARTAATIPAQNMRHPADPEQDTVRGEHW